MVSWGNLADRLEQWASSKYAKFKPPRHLEFSLEGDQSVPDDWRSVGPTCLVPYQDKLLIATNRGGGIYSLDENYNLELLRAHPARGDRHARVYHEPSDRVLLGDAVVHNSTIEDTPKGYFGGGCPDPGFSDPDRDVLAWKGKTLYAVRVTDSPPSEPASTTIPDALLDNVDRGTRTKNLTRIGDIVLAPAMDIDNEGIYTYDVGADTWDRPVTGYYVSGAAKSHDYAVLTGRDSRSALMWTTTDGSTFTRYRLPKAMNFYHYEGPIWNRIRLINAQNLLAEVYGMWYTLPHSESGRVTSEGFIPIPMSVHSWQVQDFAAFRGYLAVGHIQTVGRMSWNWMTGVPQGGLDFLSQQELWSFGKPKGWGGVWNGTSVDAGETSDPFLVNGFDEVMLHLWTDTAGDFTIEVDPVGDGTWKEYDTVSVSAGGYQDYGFPTEFNAIWTRVSFSEAASVGAWFNLG